MTAVGKSQPLTFPSLTTEGGASKEEREEGISEDL